MFVGMPTMLVGGDPWIPSLPGDNRPGWFSRACLGALVVGDAGLLGLVVHLWLA